MVIGTVARLAKATVYFGAQEIFRDLSWEIYHDARIGLVGPNGAGKSSILKLFAGEMETSTGLAQITKGVRVGYLPQEVHFDLQRSVLEEALDASPTLAALENEMHALEAQMGDPQIYGDEKKLTRVMEKHARLVQEFEAKGGLNFDNRVRATLRGLGFEDADFALPLSALSGGQKKLVGLAKLLIEQPELLLLDEPDNHLDLRGKEFLEKLIADYPGAVVIVSHDRYLLDIVAEEIAELEDGKITLYVGNYSEYQFEKHQKLLRQQQMFQVQQRDIQRLEFSIRRLMGWGAGQNEKFVRRARSMQKRLDKMEKIERPKMERRAIGLDLNAGSRGSNKVLEISHLGKSFPDPRGGTNQVLRDVNMTMWFGERVGIIGANGAGKTVLFRCILGQEEAERGEIYIGPSTTQSYYSQEHETLNFDNSVAEEVRRVKPMIDREVFGLLGRFLFDAEDSKKKIRNLSGGEKARVQMAKLMLQSANLLMLDEPTNHLDIQSAEVLEEALDDYAGSLLMISHDRYFLDNVATRILELEDGKLTEYLGNYTYYVEEKARRARGEATKYTRSEDKEEKRREGKGNSIKQKVKK
ncbi:MAG: ABC-F family ATP-binding cassette domain-containing protein [Chloroflexota bacterium]|nr:MAG: ABC-F family ATP-binding cassette domain-containing protein [Chloroflexota bacterium]